MGHQATTMTKRQLPGILL